MKCCNRKFNEALAENSFDHFKDIKELALACESFSLVDTLGRSRSINDNYIYDNYSLQTLQSTITAMACMQLNKSQYDGKNNTK
jgi:hypothetical protein